VRDGSRRNFPRRTLVVAYTRCARSGLLGANRIAMVTIGRKKLLQT
jgi:hypothetical protein